MHASHPGEPTRRLLKRHVLSSHRPSPPSARADANGGKAGGDSLRAPKVTPNFHASPILPCWRLLPRRGMVAALPWLPGVPPDSRGCVGAHFVLRRATSHQLPALHWPNDPCRHASARWQGGDGIWMPGQGAAARAGPCAWVPSNSLASSAAAAAGERLVTGLDGSP